MQTNFHPSPIFSAPLPHHSVNPAQFHHPQMPISHPSTINVSHQYSQRINHGLSSPYDQNKQSNNDDNQDDKKVSKMMNMCLMATMNKIIDKM